MQLSPGTLLKDYRIVAHLGSGGMGEVYSADDLQLNRRVALKTLRGDMVSDLHRRERWTDVPRGGWVAYLSMEGGVIIARNSANASDQSGCQPGDSRLRDCQPQALTQSADYRLGAQGSS